MWLVACTSANMFVDGCVCVCSYAVCMHSGPRGTTQNADMASKANPVTNGKMELARCMQFYPAGDSVTQGNWKLKTTLCRIQICILAGTPVPSQLCHSLHHFFLFHFFFSENNLRKKKIIF